MSSAKLRQAKTALGFVKTFRTREIQGLVGYLRKFGPLPDAVTPSTSSNQQPPAVSLPNPFIPKKHPKTGRWHEAKYSLRRQADLVKKANLSGTLDLLPPGPKKDAFQLRMDRLQQENLLTGPLVKPHDSGLTYQKYRETIQHVDRVRPAVLAEFQEAQKIHKKAAADYLEAAFAQLNQPVTEESRRKRQELHNADNDTYYKSWEIGQNLKNLDRMRKEAVAATEAAPAVDWSAEVVWVGDFKAKKVPGAHLGIRLYAGKKRMFKGHRWERLKLGMIKKRAMLVRDMPERVRNYKEYYKKRKPNPLKPSRYTKPPKLPF